MTSHSNPYSRRGDDDRYESYRQSNRDHSRDYDRDRDRDRGRDRGRDRETRDPLRKHSLPRSASFTRDNLSPRVPSSPAMASIAPTAHTAPSADLPASSTSRKPAATKFEDALRRWDDWGRRKAELQQRFELKQRDLKNKKNEYSKLGKNAEYPSASELQARFLKAHEKEVAEIDEKLKATVVEYNKATEQVMASIAQAMSPQAMSPQEIETLVQRAVEAQVQKRLVPLESSIQSNTSALKTDVKLVQEKYKDLQAKVAQVSQGNSTSEKTILAEVDKKFAAQQKVIDALLENNKRLEEQVKEARNQRITTTAQSNISDLKQMVERIETKLNVQKEGQDEEIKALRTDATKNRIDNTRLQQAYDRLHDTSARKKDLEDLRKDFNDHKNESIRQFAGVGQIKKDIQDLPEYTEMTREHQVFVSHHEALAKGLQDEMARLSNVSQEQGDLLSTVDSLTRQHQGELSRLDFHMLEQVQEAWSIEWDNLQSAAREVSVVKAEVEKLGKVEDRLRHVERHIQPADRGGPLTPTAAQAGNALSRQNSVGSRPDRDDLSLQHLKSHIRSVETDVKETNKRVKDFFASILATSTALDGLANKVKELQAAADSPQAKIPQPAQPEPMVDKLKTTVERLESHIEFLNQAFKSQESRLEETRQAQARLSLPQADLDVDEVKTKVEKVEGDYEKLWGNFEYLNLQVTALDSQYNSINTKPLAELILAQMETIYPSNREIIANQEHLHRRLHELEQQIKTLTALVRDTRHRAGMAMGQQAGQGPANKRRRIDDGVNGSPRPSADGGRSSGSPGNPPG